MTGSAAAQGRIYMDYNATAPCRAEAAEAMARCAREAWGNPSSLHAEGRAARAVLEDARERIAAVIGARPLEIVFTSGGTEADNLAVAGSLAARDGAPGHVVTTAVEHPAVLNSAAAAVPRGARVTRVPCDGTGRVAAAAVAAALAPDTVLVSIMHANNEVGTVQPVREAARLAHARGATVHCDAVQSLGRLPVRVDELEVDLLSISGHKCGGPKGTGALYVRGETALAALLQGGEQERRRRAGTENVPALAGFAAAVEAAVAEQPAETARLRALRDALWTGLSGRLPGLARNGDPRDGLPNTLNVSFGDINGEDLLMALDLAGLAVSTGSACAVGAGKPSHVLEAMGLESARCCAPVRFSLGRGTTAAQVEAAVNIVAHAAERLRAAGAGCCCRCSPAGAEG